MSRLFGGIRQLAMVVRDAETAMRQWASVGVGPFYVLADYVPVDYRDRGEAMTRPLATSSAPSISSPLSFGSIDDSP